MPLGTVEDGSSACRDGGLTDLTRPVTALKFPGQALAPRLCSGPGRLASSPVELTTHGMDILLAHLPAAGVLIKDQA
jgi:hypothetical protein